MNRKGLVLVFGTLLTLTNRGFASPILPPVFVQQGLAIDGRTITYPYIDYGFNDEFYSFGIFKNSHTSAGDSQYVTSTAVGGATPSVTSSISGSGLTGYPNGRVIAGNDITYYFMVTGPSGTPVPVIMTASGNVSYSSPNVDAYSFVQIFRDPKSDNASQAYCISASWYCDGPQTDSFNVTTTLLLDPNILYSVYVDSGVSFNPDGSVFSGYAFADPTFTLGPGLKDQGYDIAYSPGLFEDPTTSAVPEPNSLALLATGIVGVISLTHLRRRYPSVDVFERAYDFR